MQQQPLFIENVYKALELIVAHAGGPKEVGKRLFPHKSADDASKALNDSLNPNRRETLDPEQVLLLLKIGRETGFHSAKQWLDSETGYTQSQPADPAEQEAEQVRVLREAAAITARALEALERMQAKGALRPSARSAAA